MHVNRQEFRPASGRTIYELTEDEAAEAVAMWLKAKGVTLGGGRHIFSSFERRECEWRGVYRDVTVVSLIVEDGDQSAPQS